MFANSSFDRDISKWNTEKVEDFSGMFVNAPFNGDISKWVIREKAKIFRMFEGAHFNGFLWQLSENAREHAYGLDEQGQNASRSKHEKAKLKKIMQHQEERQLRKKVL
jgi:hypothetical protein